MKNFAIALDSGTVEERNEITNLFDTKKWAYWHWIDDFWIVQVPDDFTPKKLDEIIASDTILNTRTRLIFEFQGKINYWGRNTEDAWKWLSVIGNAK